jgi:hypothetical protein
MINKNEKFLKNHLNYQKFKENLMKQQNKIDQLYSKEIYLKNPKDFTINIQLDNSNYQNISLNQDQSQKNDDINISLLENNNIFRIRLNQTKETLIELSKRKWPNIIISKNILDIKGNVNIIIILLFKALGRKNINRFDI